MAKCSPCLFSTSFSFLLCYTSVTLAQFHCFWMTELSFCLNERGCSHTGWFDGTQQRLRPWLLFTGVFMSDMQKWSSVFLLPFFQLFPRTLWEINHIISYTHIAPSSIILSTANCKAKNNFVHFTKFTCYLIASKIGRMWTLLILTVENEITFFITSPLWCKWDWITLHWNSTGHIPKHVYGTEQSHWSQ